MPLFHTQGIIRWFQLACKHLFTATINGVHVPFTAMGLWDSHPKHPDGRVGYIVDKYPYAEHMLLRKGDCGVVLEPQRPPLEPFWPQLVWALCTALAGPSVLWRLVGQF